MANYKLGLFIVLMSSLAGGCVTSGAATPHDEFGAHHEPPDEPGRCESGLHEIESAPSPSSAIAAVEGYLTCLSTWSAAPPVHLDRRIGEALTANPYPRTRRQAAQIRARFFDRTLLKRLPQTRRELEPYVDLLRAQTLRAQAEQDTRFVQAAQKRAQSLSMLSRVLDALEDAG